MTYDARDNWIDDPVYVGVEKMRGLTFTAVEGCKAGSEEIIFTAEDGRRFYFWHCQDCCEHVEVNQVDGDPADLVGAPLVMAEEETDSAIREDYGSQTWTFYKFGTAKGYVTVRWLGTSNGYYSESVSLRVEEA